MNGLIGTHNYEWNLRPNYYANLPVIGENFLPYRMMLTPEVAESAGIVKDYDDHYLRWTPQRFRETIEISHLSIYAFDQDSHHSYEFYNEQKDLVEEMNNRLGYNFTVTSAKRNENKLLVTVKNTGLAPAFFNIELTAELTDEDGNKLGTFGTPVMLEKGSFHDEEEKTFLFEYDGVLDEDVIICLAMYDSDNYLVAGKDPTIKFDNKNSLSNNRLLLVNIPKENETAEEPKESVKEESVPTSEPAKPTTIPSEPSPTVEPEAAHLPTEWPQPEVTPAEPEPTEGPETELVPTESPQSEFSGAEPHGTEHPQKKNGFMILIIVCIGLVVVVAGIGAFLWKKKKE